MRGPCLPRLEDVWVPKKPMGSPHRTGKKNTDLVLLYQYASLVFLHLRLNFFIPFISTNAYCNSGCHFVKTTVLYGYCEGFLRKKLSVHISVLFYCALAAKSSRKILPTKEAIYCKSIQLEIVQYR